MNLEELLELYTGSNNITLYNKEGQRLTLYSNMNAAWCIKNYGTMDVFFFKYENDALMVGIIC